MIAIAKDPAPPRTAKTPIIAVEGVSPSARNLADMGIRAAPSSEPWIQSNIWLVRSFRFSEAWRPVWISYPPDRGSMVDYARSVADAAVAGGRWIVTLDDDLRAGLRRKDAGAWPPGSTSGTACASQRSTRNGADSTPYGNLGVIVDTAAPGDMADEYLKLLMRRQVPYRLIARSELSAASLDGFRALLATELAPPDASRTENYSRLRREWRAGGGRSRHGASLQQDSRSRKRPQEKAAWPCIRNRIQSRSPETCANFSRSKDAGVMPFNVPSVITYASREIGGKRLLVQLLNYSDLPPATITSG